MFSSFKSTEVALDPVCWLFASFKSSEVTFIIGILEIDVRVVTGRFIVVRVVTGRFVDGRVVTGRFVDIRVVKGIFVDVRVVTGRLVRPKFSETDGVAGRGQGETTK